MNTGDLSLILDGLESTPILLRHLVEATPKDRLDARRIPGKWSIHEHVCHLTSIHPLMKARLKLFREQVSPAIEPSEGLLPLEPLEDALDRFDTDRRELVAAGRSLSPEILKRKARHPEYDVYTPSHLFRHVLLHDHAHLYRIEELALTTDACLPKP